MTINPNPIRNPCPNLTDHNSQESCTVQGCVWEKKTYPHDTGGGFCSACPVDVDENYMPHNQRNYVANIDQTGCYGRGFGGIANVTDDCKNDGGMLQEISYTDVTGNHHWQCVCPPNTTKKSIEVNSRTIARCFCNEGMERGAPDPASKDSSQCQQCGKGYFKAQVGTNADDNNNRCTECPGFSTGSETSKTDRLGCTCTAGHYRGNDGCTRCEANKYKTQEGDEAELCISCPKENQVPNDGQTDCVCKSGYYLDNDTCVLCAAGFIKPDKGNHTCTPCANNGSEIANEERTVCICANGYGKVTGEDRCELCENGYQVPDPATAERVACTTCDINGFQVVNGQKNACVCAPGYGVESNDQGGCQSCGAGKINSEEDVQVGATMEACKACLKDQNASLDHKKCLGYGESCDDNAEPFEGQCYCRGGYQLEGTICKRCDDGSISDGKNGKCTPCNKTTPANPTQTECVTKQNCGKNAEAINSQCYCKAGYGVKNSACEECDHGLMSPDKSNECVKCAGTGGDVVSLDQRKCQTEDQCIMHGNTTLQPAGDGKSRQCVCKGGFEIRNSEAKCVACVDGISSNGANKCAPCVGKYEIANEAHTACVCESGYGFYENECVQCPDGTYHAVTAFDAEKVTCTACGKGLIPNKNKTGCEAKLEKSVVDLTPIIIGLVLVLFLLLAIIMAVVLIKKKHANQRSKGENRTGGINYYNKRVRMSTEQRRGQGMQRQMSVSKASVSQASGQKRGRVEPINRRARQLTGRRNLSVVGNRSGYM